MANNGWSGLFGFFVYIGWVDEMGKFPGAPAGAPPEQIMIGTIIEPFGVRIRKRGLPRIVVPRSIFRGSRVSGVYGEMAKNLDDGTLVEPRVTKEPFRGPPVIIYGLTAEEKTEREARQQAHGQAPREPGLPRHALGCYTTNEQGYAGIFGGTDIFGYPTTGSGIRRGVYRWLR